MIKTQNPERFLSLLWAFILFNMIFRDLHQMLAPGYIDEMRGMQISEGSLLFYGFILELPILMMLLSNYLKPKTNRFANILVSVLVAGGIISTFFTADADDLFFGIVKLIALGLIFVVALRLPQGQ
ncbi:DUF6326 family protein [Gilvibacter sediminis]|uniref:DUF6326 family protein n=1 Tax=Gilvibacter sediminis TaxID=379071 RepID=UPI0023506818|nr:DUF6326 family protein [Gilvibacter sediminis]MDC7998605.1 DUF6326 family protein [Gilvibacter sediminis]